MAATLNTPKPKDGEMQPDFAIRFHESMMDDVPNTDERNQMCLEAWRDSVGDEPEVGIARKYHKSDEYDERRDIPVFEEHVIPERMSKDGKRKIPSVKYDKRALASICKNMNAAIADVGKFCPITNGHTSDDPKDPEPEVLAYTGAYRLGMIGNTKPRYAIFADEYHRKDRADIMKGRRGRSVEVLPIPDVHKRSFYPIAALGADEPRLNLPPARYAKDAAGETYEVERYMMVAPGGNSTFIPDDDRQKYGDCNSNGPLSPEVIRQLMEAFTQTSYFQWIIGKMEEEGKAGSVNPLVHQPPQMADMPADNQLGGDPNLAGPIGPAQDAAKTPGFGGIPTNSPEDTSGMGDPAGDSKPTNEQGKKMSEQNTEKYSKSAGLQAIEDRLAKLETENEQTKAENAALKAKLVGAERYSKLSGLAAQGIEMDLTEEMEVVATQSDEQFDKYCKRISDKYRRSPSAVADFSAFHQAGRKTSPDAKPQNEFDTLTEDQNEEVVKYALNNGLDYIAARERYIKENKKSDIAG